MCSPGLLNASLCIYCTLHIYNTLSSADLSVLQLSIVMYKLVCIRICKMNLFVFQIELDLHFIFNLYYRGRYVNNGLQYSTLKPEVSHHSISLYVKYVTIHLILLFIIWCHSSLYVQCSFIYYFFFLSNVFIFKFKRVSHSKLLLTSSRIQIVLVFNS